MEMDEPPDIQTVDLLSVESIELGYECVNQSTRFSVFTNNSNKSISTVPYMKIFFKDGDQTQFYLFRSSNMKFFNNVVIRIQPEEMYGESPKIRNSTLIVIVL